MSAQVQANPHGGLYLRHLSGPTFVGRGSYQVQRSSLGAVERCCERLQFVGNKAWGFTWEKMGIHAADLPVTSGWLDAGALIVAVSLKGLPK